MNKRPSSITTSGSTSEPAKRNKTRDPPGQAEEPDQEINDNPKKLDFNSDAELNREDLFELVESYIERIGQSEELELDDIERAIDYGTRALELTPNDHPDLPHRHACLARSHDDRFTRLGEPGDLKKAFEHNARALELTPEGHPDLPERHAAVALAYIDRLVCLEGELDDLNKAFEHGTRALELTPEDHPDLADRHGILGEAYINRFRRLRELDDLKKAVEYHTRALELTPDGHPDLPGRHSALGQDYDNRFKHLGELDDLEKALTHYHGALGLTPDGDPHLHHLHNQLGTAYNSRFEVLGKLDDLDEALEHHTRALKLTPDGDPGLPFRHVDLGIDYNDRYWRLGEVDDLDKSIEHHTHAVRLTPDGDPGLIVRYAHLGTGYATRYQRLGELDDLEKSLEHGVHALELTPKGDPDFPGRQAHLASVYSDRFERLGKLDDLEKALGHYTRALELTPEGHPDLPGRYADLGGVYTSRFQLLGELDAVEKAIEYYIHAVTLTPDNHPGRPDLHKFLGMCYGYRYRRLEETKDHEQAIAHFSRALALTPEDYPELHDLHADLGRTYNDRYKRLVEPDEPDELDKAIEHASLAVALAPDGHPNLPRNYLIHATVLFHAYHHTGDPSRLSEALASFRKASQLPFGPPLARLENAVQWAEYASTHDSLNCIEAHQTAIDLLPQLIWLGVTTNQRYHHLSMITNIAVNAASAAIPRSNYELALEWLEHARCVVWNQSVMLRSPVDNLRLSHPDLAARLERVAEQLHNASSESPQPRIESSSSAMQKETGQWRRQLTKEYNSLLAEARMLPGFHDLLLPMTANQLVRAARYGPVVVINCHEDRCDALVIHPEQDNIQHLPLPNFSEQKAQSNRSELGASLRSKGVRERGVKTRRRPEDDASMARVLSVLWKDVVKPVLEFLGYMENTSVKDLPHITWCPTGTLSFLPLHAAGDYDQPGSRVFNYAISSYTPTLSALFGSTPVSPDRTPRVLAIGQASTPGHRPLPGTTKELACVKSHTTNAAEYSELVGNKATTKEVLDAMEQHDWVHLACHAHQNVSDPTRSGFFLYDGTLDLVSINRRSFKNKGLAFLSACQTATGDEELPDEAVHLASGMLMAGYPSVIATMWSVKDADAPVIADKVYAQLLKDGKVGNGEAGKALHHAVAALRNQVGEKEFVRWVPYIHIGS